MIYENNKHSKYSTICKDSKQAECIQEIRPFEDNVYILFYLILRVVFVRSFQRRLLYHSVHHLWIGYYALCDYIFLIKRYLIIFWYWTYCLKPTNALLTNTLFSWQIFGRTAFIILVNRCGCYIICNMFCGCTFCHQQ